MKQKTLISSHKTKLIIISSIVVLGFTSGFIYREIQPMNKITNNKVTSPIVNNVVSPVTTTPSISDSVDTKVDTLPTTDTVNSNTVTESVQPVTSSTVIDYNQLYIDTMLKNFISRGPVYILINQHLKVQYPEKFSDTNLQSTMDYLINYFSDPNKSTTESMYSNFTW